MDVSEEYIHPQVVDGYWIKQGPPLAAHPSDHERFESEVAIYNQLGSHERILPFRGVHPTHHALRFDYLPKGDLAEYLRNVGVLNVPLKMRLQWMIDAAEGIAYLHSKGVVWVDATPSNMLLTDDFRIVLSDFAGSSFMPDFLESVRPTGAWLGPREYVCFTEAQDRFAFGTFVFLLLLDRFPHCDCTWYTSYEDMTRVEKLHEAGVYDEGVSSETYPVLAEVIQKCWRNEYKSTEAMLDDVRRGRDACLKLASTVTKSQSTIVGESAKNQIDDTTLAIANVFLSGQETTSLPS